MPYNDNIFQANWKRFARMFTPVDMRRPRWLALLYAILSAVGELHARFLSWRRYVLYRLSINYQVCRLEKLLNDRYDVSRRGIYIENKPPVFDPVIFYQEEEAIPVPFYVDGEPDAQPVVFYLKEETQAGRINFIIYVPDDIVFDLPQLIGLVKQYSLASKNFLVTLYHA